jgi:uncharacterized protein YndB with AHSA1/START domain
VAEIRHVLDIEAPPEAVYQVIATREGVARWWTPRIDGSDELGGTMRMHFDAVGSTTDMRVVALEPSRLVEWESTAGDFEGTLTRFDLEPRGEGTFLRFTQSRWPSVSDQFGTCNFLWGFFMQSLKQLVETGVGTPR